MTGLLYLCLSLASAQSREFGSVTEEIDGARIDWTEYRLEITTRSNRTVGAWQSWQGQEQEVVEILGEKFPIASEQVVLRPGISAGSIMSTRTELGLRTERESRKWHIEETRYHTAGGVEIDAYLEIGPWLSPSLKEFALDQRIPLPETGPTGVIIDARGVDFAPALSPTIVLGSGQNLTRADRVSLETLEDSSAVLYLTDPADPRAQERAGNDPVFALAHEGARGTMELQNTEWTASPDLDALVANGRIVIIMDSVSR